MHRRLKCPLTGCLPIRVRRAGNFSSENEFAGQLAWLSPNAADFARHKARIEISALKPYDSSNESFVRREIEDVRDGPTRASASANRISQFGTTKFDSATQSRSHKSAGAHAHNTVANSLGFLQHKLRISGERGERAEGKKLAGAMRLVGGGADSVFMRAEGDVDYFFIDEDWLTRDC